ncbi:MAG TPA: trigger factor [Nevskiaceae bacterium]|nr:trigger factor [Nevskiaceae bacterium]
MISALNKLPDGTIELTITIPLKRVKTSYDEVLKKQAAKVEIKGFRKGKAPQKLVEQKIGKNALYEEVLKTLIPQVYTETVKEQNIKPILNPQIKVVSLQEGKDWQIKALTCELPEVKLGDYRVEIKKQLAPGKIWTPDKEKQTNKLTREDKIAQIFKVLAGNIQIKLPEILVEQEVNRMFSRLIDQTNQLGLTVEQYLTSTGKTNQQLRDEYRKQAEETLKLELVLAQIAEKEKVTVTEAEIEKMIEAVPDEKVRIGLKTPDQQIYIRQLLRKRKVIDNLLKL